MEFHQDDLLRYSRQLILPEIGIQGQNKIREARVLCVGAGGLGSPAALYLAAAGVGTLGIVDSDEVDLSNLQRQVLHDTPHLGWAKTASAQERLGDLNPAVQIHAHHERLTSRNASAIIEHYDFVLDGSDNFPTRYLVNDACVLLRKPLVYGAVFRFDGQASVLAPSLGGPCYRCLFPEPPPPGAAPSCAEAGVLGVVPGIIGLLQATEALKLILQTGSLLLGRLLLFDALGMTFREVQVKPDPNCNICGKNPTIKELTDYPEAGCIQEKQTMHPNEVTVQDMKHALEDPSKRIHVIDVREPDEQQIARVAGVPLLPLSTLPNRYKELDPQKTYYLHCRSGGRSMLAVEFLRSKGFKHVKSVKGGITAWSNEIDPKVPKY